MATVVTKVTGTIKCTDTDGEDITYNIGYINPIFSPTSTEEITIDGYESKYAYLDACARAINGLSKASYVDFIISATESISISEAIYD